jgi:ribosomal protein S18 acetylase RimI-like enzyme
MIQIRDGRPADIPQLLELWRGAANSVTVSDTEAGLLLLLERDAQACSIAHSDGRIVGSLICGWDGWRANLYRLAVHPDHRRQGIATALLRRAERRLSDLGAIRIAAIVDERDSQALAFWRATGYQRQPHRARLIRHLDRAPESVA